MLIFSLGHFWGWDGSFTEEAERMARNILLRLFKGGRGKCIVSLFAITISFGKYEVRTHLTSFGPLTNVTLIKLPIKAGLAEVAFTLYICCILINGINFKYAIAVLASSGI